MKVSVFPRFSMAGILLATLNFLNPFSVSAQSFVDINAGLPGVSNSSVIWGDYDNDQDMDPLICGETANGLTITKLYNNDNGVFTESNIEFAGLKNGWVRWGDYDNDGDLDLLATGNNDDNQTFIYKNELNTFTDINPGLDYFGAYSSASWGDYDNDGDLDVFITGGWNSKLYRNEGSDNFTDTELEFVMMSGSRSSWGDFDNDGDMDILLTGDTGGGMKLYCYINSGENFEEVEMTEPGLSAGSVEWGDYDSDGDLDILIMGFNDFIEPEASIYRNDGDNIFTNIYAGLPPVAMGNATWGDYENDGDLDVLISGKLAGCGVFTTAVYENLGNDFFNDINAGLANAERSSVAWGDFDNDTDLDILLAGINYSGTSFTKIYRNDFSLPNLLPDAPQNLSVSFENESVVLNWDKANDPQTPQEGLYYNIRLGTGTLECNSLSPMAHLENGYRKINEFGNVSQSNFWKLSGLEQGTTYYWSVQTIDNTYGASGFSEEQSFYFSLTNTQDRFLNAPSIQVFPNPAQNHIVITLPEGNHDNFLLDIYSLKGKKVLQKQAETGESINLSGMVKGIYFLIVNTEDKSFTEKLILK